MQTVPLERVGGGTVLKFRVRPYPGDDMDHTGTFWNIPSMHSFQPDANIPPIPEVDYDAAWCQTDPEASDHYLPLDQPTQYAANPNPAAGEIANLAEQVRQLQSNILDVKEKTRASLSELTDFVNKWSQDTDKTLVQMSKDIVNLDRNYLRLMPWCYQVHEKVSECIAERNTAQTAPSAKK